MGKKDGGGKGGQRSRRKGGSLEMLIGRLVPTEKGKVAEELDIYI